MNDIIQTAQSDEVGRGIEGWRESMVALRHDLHRYPELAYQEHRTAAKVAELLDSWGYRVTRGIGGTGVVGTLTVGSGQRRLGLRADMDALPIGELTALPYASGTAGQMHACGHDGHTTALLAAARQLAETQRFSGTLNLIFQPAEENAAGAKRMIDDGLFERFPCDAVFGFHNWPGLPLGHFAFRDGPTMASVDSVNISLIGKGGHGAAPHQTVDPVVAASALVVALQSVVSRNLDPLDTAVVTVGSIHGGAAANVIPDSVELGLTVRTFSDAVRDRIEARITALAQAQAESFGAEARIDYQRGYPVLVNHPEETAIAREVAIEHYGAARLVENLAPITASEDFAYLLEACPGSYLYIGNGDSASLHSPHYEFNDEILTTAAGYWVHLAERYLG